MGGEIYVLSYAIVHDLEQYERTLFADLSTHSPSAHGVEMTLCVVFHSYI